MSYTIDLRTDEPRSAHETLGGVKLLARLIDKGRAAICGTLGPYLFYDCPLDRVFFEALNVSRDEFLEVLRQAYLSHLPSDLAALADLREAVACEPEISDEYFIAHAEAADVDDSTVTWLLDQRHTPPSVLAAINAAVDCLPPECFVDQSSTAQTTRQD